MVEPTTIEAVAIVVAAVPLAVVLLVLAAEVQWRSLESSFRRDRDDAVRRAGRRLLPQLRVIERLDSLIHRRPPRGPGGTGPVGTSVHCYLGLAAFHQGDAEGAATHLGLALRSPDRSVAKAAWVESCRPTYWLALRSLGRLDEAAADFDLAFDPSVPVAPDERALLHLLAGTHLVSVEERAPGRRHYEALVALPGWAEIDLPGVIAVWFWLVTDDMDHGDLHAAAARLTAGRALPPVAATRFPDLLEVRLAAERAEVDRCLQLAHGFEATWSADDDPRTRFAIATLRHLALRHAGRTAHALVEAERVADLVDAAHDRIGILSPIISRLELADAQLDEGLVDDARHSLADAEATLAQVGHPFGERNLARLDVVRSRGAEADGDLPGAVALATAARERAARNGFALDEAEALVQLAHLTWIGGDRAGAVDLAATARTQLAERAGPARVEAVERRHPELFPAAA